MVDMVAVTAAWAVDIWVADIWAVATLVVAIWVTSAVDHLAA